MTYGSAISLGSNTLLFEKLGFASENFSFTVNTSSDLNITFNATESKIVLRIFDRDTQNLLIGLSEVTLVATVGFNATTVTGLLNITDINFLSEQYQIIVEHVNFTTESVFFTYNNQETINVDIFLLNLSLPTVGLVEINVVADTGQLIQGAVCRALEWRPAESAFITVAQSLTDINGETLLNVEIGTKLYKFSCTKAGVTVTSNQQIIQVSGTIVAITMPTQFVIPEPSLLTFTGNVTNQSVNGSHEIVIFDFIDPAGTVVQGCLQIFQKSGTTETLLQENCTASSQGQLQLLVDVNQTFTTVAKGVVTVDGFDTIVDELVFSSRTSLETGLKKYGLHILVPLLLLFLGMSLGLMIKPENIFLSMIGAFIGVWFGFIIVPSIISFSIATFAVIIIAFMMWGGARRK